MIAGQYTHDHKKLLKDLLQHALTFEAAEQESD